MWVEYLNNPVGRRVGDCSVRAISKALNMGWEAAYIALTINGLQMGDMPSSDAVSGALLRQHGFYRKAINNECPSCYTVKEFCEEHPKRHICPLLWWACCYSNRWGLLRLLG